MEYSIGDKVVFINREIHEEFPQWYPDSRTKGEIMSIDFDDDGIEYIKVQWEPRSTSMDDVWTCTEYDIEPDIFLNYSRTIDEQKTGNSRKGTKKNLTGVEEETNDNS